MKLLNYICLLLLLQGCSGQEPLREDFIGKWKSSNGSLIELTRDGHFNGIKVDMSKIIYDVDDLEGKALQGRWELTTDNYGKQVIKISTEKYRFNFYIVGEGLFEKTPPWRIYSYIGDPDDMNKYEFIKQ